MDKLKQILIIVLVSCLIPTAVFSKAHESKISITLTRCEPTLSPYNDPMIPCSTEEVAAIVAEKMGIDEYPMPVVKNMTQEEFNFSFFKDINCHNQIKGTYAYFFLEENVINWGPQFPLDRLAHEIVHYFQKFLGYDMDSEDIYYEMEEQASSIQLWFRENHSHGF